jgi:AbrB family looped-hinge helix DNA binding protein
MDKTKQRRRRGYTRLSSKRQVTIPVAVLGQSGLGPGDELKVELDEAGRIVLVPVQTVAQRRERAIRETAGRLAGTFAHDDLDRLRDEWR